MTNNGSQTLSFVYLKVSNNQNNSNEEQNVVPVNEQNELSANTTQPPLENEHAASPETPPLILQTEPPMEVHAHTHTPRKKWTHYFWEFFMLFLAVTLGFFVENQREHYVENQREKKYIQSFYEDLTADEYDLQLNINFLRDQKLQADTLQKLMLNVDIKQPANAIYMYLRGITRSSGGRLYPNDRTIVQLRNAGGMRLIKNKGASDSMVSYYRTADIIQFLTDEGLNNRRLLRERYMPLLNAGDFIKVLDTSNSIVNVPENLYLRKADPDIINDCLIEIDRIKTLNLALAIRIQLLKEKAGRIKNFIKKEYHLK